MSYNIDWLLQELVLANQKATEASDKYNAEVKRITSRETRRFVRQGQSDKTILASIIRDIKDKSVMLKDLSGKQQFYSGEVVRISALLNGILAHWQLVKMGFVRSD